MKLTRVLSAFMLTLSLAFGASMAKADTAPTITPATSSVTADSVTGASVALPALAITEGAAGNIHAGTLVWALPAGFVFDTASVPNVVYAGTGLAGDAAVTFPTNSTMSVVVSAPSTAVGSLTIGSTTAMKVKATAGTPLATGNITLSTGIVDGLTSTSNFGTLTEVPGAASKLAFTVQPPTSIGKNTAFSATVAVQDQFGNTLTADSTRSITLSPVLSSDGTTAGTGTLGGTLTMNDASGLAAFTNLTYSAVESIKLKAVSTDLTQALSNAIVVTQSGSGSGSGTGTCSIHNGILVKIQGSDTVYMVVNCSLRPFTSAAIFHARGKKFQNIVILNQGLNLPIGNPVGQSNDDDVATPDQTPSAASLTGQASTLPNGSVVKVPNDPTVYMVVNGTLQPFTSLSVFKSYGKKFSDIQTLTTDQLSQLGINPTPVSFSNNTLVQGSNQTIYVIRDGKKLGIPSMSALRKLNLSLKNLIKVGDQEINNVTDGGVAE